MASEIRRTESGNQYSVGAQPSKVSQIEKELISIRELVAKLNNQTVMLQERLTVVMIPPAMERALVKTLNEQREGGSGMALGLNEIAESLSELFQRVVDIQERLDL